MKNRTWVMAALLGTLLALPLSAQAVFANQDFGAHYQEQLNGGPLGSATEVLSVQSQPGTVYNAWQATCTLPGGSCGLNPSSGFLSPGIGFNIQVHATAAPPFTGTGTVYFTIGVFNGSDQPVVPLPFQFSTTNPTNDATNGDFAGDPISTATGELYNAIPPDLALGGPLPLFFERYYASQILANGLATRLGNNWMHNFEWLLTLNGNQAVVTRFGAKTIAFNQSGASWTLANAEQDGYQLVTGSNNTYQFLDPRTNLIYTFSGTGTSLGNTSIQDRNGNTLTIALPSNGSSQVSDALGRSLTFTYDSSSKLIRVADQTGRSVSFAYTGNDLTQFTDANGKIETYSYTTSGSEVGLMASATLPLGNKPQSQTWDQYARVATQSDSRGDTATMTYDQPQGSAVYKDALGALMTDTSQNYADFLTYTDPDNQTLSVTYDANDRRNSVTDRLGNNISMTFHSPSGYLASVTDAAGNTTTNTWQAQVAGPFTFYVLTKVQYADGTSTSYTYDASGNVLTATDAAGKITKYTYNSRGQRLTETDPVGRTAKSAYNADGTLASTTDAAGNMTTYASDALKRVNLVTFADGTTQSTTYDNLDHVVARGNGGAQTTTYTFNDNEELVSTGSGSGNPSTTAYDTDEHVLKTTDRMGLSTSYTYNQLGLDKSVTTPAGETYTFAYDTHHRQSAALDPSGNRTAFAYDKEDALASVTDALSRKTSFIADKIGLVTQVTTPLGENYMVARDKFERVTSVTDPSGIAETATYDPRGLETGIAIGNLSAAFSHDDSGLLTGITDPNGNTWSFGYDAGGHMAVRTDPLKRATTFSFDKRNRVSGVQMPIGSIAFTLDTSGNVLRRLYSDGTDLNYTFGGGGLATGPGVALTYDAEGRMTGSNGLVITVDADGRIVSVSYAPGKTVTYAYNPVGLLASVMDWVGGSTTFTYDAAQELISMMRPNGLSTQFTYGGDGRLASITESAGSSVVIHRDPAGKTLSETRTQPQSPTLASGMLPLAFDAADQVAGSNYDAMGRLNGDSLRTYTWDLASRLKSYSGADGAATAAYDGLGLRTSVNSSLGLRKFVWNYATGVPSLATVQDASGDRRYYIYLPDGTLLYAIDASTSARHFYHFDENGSTVLLSNDAGAITDSYGITPYGETVTQNGTTENPFTWLGQWGAMQEGSTSLYYMRARYYDSATARFLSPDPIMSADPVRVNPYQYALANPMQYVDPSGLFPEYVFDATTNTFSTIDSEAIASTGLLPPLTNTLGLIPGLGSAQRFLGASGNLARPVIHNEGITELVGQSRFQGAEGGAGGSDRYSSNGTGSSTWQPATRSSNSWGASPDGQVGISLNPCGPGLRANFVWTGVLISDRPKPRKLITPASVSFDESLDSNDLTSAILYLAGVRTPSH